MGLPKAVAGILRASLAPSVDVGTLERMASGLAPGDVHGLGSAARFHGIPGYVQTATSSLSVIPERERTYLLATRRQAALAHLRVVADLRLIDRVFATVRVPWMVVKGPALAEPVHGSAELRYYGDLDVVVPPAGFPTAIEALEEAGAEVIDRNWTLIRAEMKGEVHLRLPSGTALDLHWHLLNSRHHRERFPIKVDELIERRVEVAIGGKPVPTLCPADAVVHVAMHLLLSGADRLVWGKDLERLLWHEMAEIPDILSVAEQWRARLLLAGALSRMSHTIEAPPLARDLQAAVAPGRLWQAATSRVWKASPLEMQDGHGSLGRVVARSFGTSQRDSLVELLRRTRRHLEGGGGQTSGRELRDDDPGSGRHESGGREARAAYLRAVVSQGTTSATRLL